jgi:hypothetical protein
MFFVLDYDYNKNVWLSEESETNTSLGTRRNINKLFREQDDSHLWPVSGKFNVTERAIRKANKMEQANGSMSPLEYALFIEHESSRIVNSIH